MNLNFHVCKVHFIFQAYFNLKLLLELQHLSNIDFLSKMFLFYFLQYIPSISNPNKKPKNHLKLDLYKKNYCIQVGLLGSSVKLINERI